MTNPRPDVDLALHELVTRLDDVEVVHTVWVGGSLATGDYHPTVSDVDLVAVTSEPLGGRALARVREIHEDLDAGVARGLDLGCQYADEVRLHLVAAEHPTWTHGDLVDRTVSGVTRAELVLHGYSLMGREPPEVLAPVTPDDVRVAARAELTGYWSYAAARPLMFLRLPEMVDLGLTAMARGRHALATGELQTKSAAIEHARAPDWLTEQLRERRRGHDVTSPRWRAAYHAWRDVRRTTAAVRSSTSDDDARPGT